jgi:hypothetical protein
VTAPIWDTIATEAAAESVLWEGALLPRDQREPIPVFSPLGSERFALAVETIYEGYLLHYGAPRLFARADADTAVLLGDYLYAHGLVRLAEHGDVTAVADLAELISLCTQLRAEPPGAAPDGADGVAWAATAALLGDGNGLLEGARAALRLHGDVAALERLASAAAGELPLRLALFAHRVRVE